MKVVVQGQGEVSLTQREFVAAGGEGSIYARGVTAYKIYQDPARMLPVGKITELAAIKDPNVIKPERVIHDGKDRPVGYTMRFIQDAMPLCQVFTRAFREREGLDHPQMLKLVRALQDMIAHIHAAGVLVVDLNELNFLVDKAFLSVFAIDVDSYQTKSYPATAIMPSVRDFSVQQNHFTDVSDWFSFACVSFQMFTGIHPYKGKHASVHGLEERMKAGISVFDAGVSVPKVVYPVDVIPVGYRAWLKAVLQDGKRLLPPTDPLAIAPIVVVTRGVVGGAVFDINLLFTFAGPILGYAQSADQIVVSTIAGLYLNQRQVSASMLPVRAIGFTSKMNHAVVAYAVNQALQLYDLTSMTEVKCTLRADDIMGHEGRIYVRSGERIIEMYVSETGAGLVAGPRVVANVLEHATRMYDGVVVQTLLGSTFVNVFTGSGISYQRHIRELDGKKIVDAKYENHLLMVIVTDAGRYDRLAFVFDTNFDAYKVRPSVLDIVPAGLNFVVLDNGVVVHLNEDEELEVWALTSDTVRKVKDPALGNDMRLVKYGGKVAFIRDNKIWSMRMK